MYAFIESDITYLERLLLPDGKLQILPHAVLKDIPQIHISQFCVQHGIYLIPTIELVEYLKILIHGKNTIEIGSGNGVLADSLGIPGTDSYIQNQPNVKKYMADINQAIVTYGENVHKLDTLKAIQLFKPECVLACWVTHKYNPNEPLREGSEYGVNENLLLRKVKMYIHIGNLAVHDKKPIQEIICVTMHKPWIVSRSIHPGKNVIQIWGNYDKKD